MITHNEIGEMVAEYYFSGFQGVQSFAQFVMSTKLKHLSWPEFEQVASPVTATMILQSLAECSAGRAFELYDRVPMPKALDYV
jgi:hypothetical protein